jgi:hypothetical protein
MKNTRFIPPPTSKVAKLKISYRFNPSKFHMLSIAKQKKIRRNSDKHYCLGCGSPLSDPISIARGYGSKCWAEVPVIIVLEIEPNG